MNKQSLFSLQGYFRAHTRLENGKPGPGWWLGNVPEATLDLSIESTTKRESFSGARGNYGKMKTGQNARFTGVMDEWSVKNLALLLHAKNVETATGSITGEQIALPVAKGDQFRLAKPYASALVLTDSATPTPATISSDKYHLVGHNDAVIEFLEAIADGDGPLNLAYTHAAFNDLEFFSEPSQEVYIIFDGIDTESGQPVLVDMYRAEFDPVQNLPLINAEYGSLAFGADLLFDPLNVNAGGKGGYARITSKAVAG